MFECSNFPSISAFRVAAAKTGESSYSYSSSSNPSRMKQKHACIPNTSKLSPVFCPTQFHLIYVLQFVNMLVTN